MTNSKPISDSEPPYDPRERFSDWTMDNNIIIPPPPNAGAPSLTEPPTSEAPIAHPKPDFSPYIPNRSKTPENDTLDIGWNEGVLSDGRPYRIECWAPDQTTNVTVFLPTAGLENYSNAQFVELLEQERVVWWHAGCRKSAYAVPVTDSAGNSMWSINVVIGVEDDPAVGDTVPIRPYASRH